MSEPLLVTLATRLPKFILVTPRVDHVRFRLMDVKSKLDKVRVSGWLRGHKIASFIIEKERFRSLASLTAKESAEIYQSLAGSVTNGTERQRPSPVLWYMRKTIKRYSKLVRKRNA